jgi:hypothetical protein
MDLLLRVVERLPCPYPIYLSGSDGIGKTRAVKNLPKSVYIDCLQFLSDKNIIRTIGSLLKMESPPNGKIDFIKELSTLKIEPKILVINYCYYYA